MPRVSFATYYRYDDLTQILHAYATEHPALIGIESAGKSYEGRDIWLITATNTATGPDRDKPALWVDGNIHASEVSSSSACLYLIDRLVAGYGVDEEITRCLDTRVFYICPRIGPDGAEWALADQPRVIRSSTRPYPYDEEPIEGLQQEDIDGDGRILMMRLLDPQGSWKEHPDEPRLLVRRDPIETGGRYFRVLPEGRIDNFDGVTITYRRPKQRLDLNRTFPARWRPEGQQPGAGPYPGSEAETQTVLRFIASHPNITGAVTFHTYAGVLLRPFSGQNDDAFVPEDLWTYKKIGQKGTEITGYPAASVFHDFLYHPKEVVTGAFDDWMFESQGVFAWTVELWSPQRQAGITDYKYIDWYREHPIDDDLKLLHWSDEALGGRGYVAWYPFEHPQLGLVELGGWDLLHAWRNPPVELLEKEIAPFPRWLVWHLLISPRLELFDAQVIALGEDTYRIRLVVHNTGWLPTYISKQALEAKAVRGVVCEIDLPDGATLVTGKPREEVGQLEGRAYTGVSITGADADVTDERVRVEWVIRAPAGGTVRLTARHDRAGMVRVEHMLPRPGDAG